MVDYAFRKFIWGGEDPVPVVTTVLNCDIASDRINFEWPS